MKQKSIHEKWNEDSITILKPAPAKVEEPKKEDQKREDGKQEKDSNKED